MPWKGIDFWEVGEHVSNLPYESTASSYMYPIVDWSVWDCESYQVQIWCEVYECTGHGFGGSVIENSSIAGGWKDGRMQLLEKSYCEYMKKERPYIRQARASYHIGLNILM